jgi:hypothetical protein
MNDFITFECPNCGGKLTISPNTARLKCEYCGREHIIRNKEGILIVDEYKKCPECNKNDMAKKITSLNLNPPMEPKKPKEPEKPKETSSGYGGAWAILWFPAVLTTAAIGVFLGVGLPTYLGLFTPKGGFTITGFLLLGLGILLSTIINIIFWTWFDRKELNSKKARDEKKYAVDYPKYIAVDYPKYLIDKTKWDKAIDKWNRLYYCERDDIYFDPMTNGICERGKFLEFIYS